MVKLGEVIKRADRFEKKSPFETYSFSGTYSYAKGIFKSYDKKGSEFDLEKIQRIKEGDFIFCKIMAWERAFGLAQKSVTILLEAAPCNLLEKGEKLRKSRIIPLRFPV